MQRHLHFVSKSSYFPGVISIRAHLVQHTLTHSGVCDPSPLSRAGHYKLSQVWMVHVVC